jgi:geranylgeranyl transferase type-2 subunit alpha
MESLVHYKLLLLRNHYPTTADTVRQECVDLLQRLIKLDPARQQRYKEIGKLGV